MNQPPSTVDLARALLPQVGRLGDAYDAWVHRSLKPKGSLRLFASDRLEALSHIPWWHVLVVWVPITALLGAHALSSAAVGPGRFLWLALLGLLLWTLLEYVLHRFAFHFKPRSDFGRRLHFLAHGIHHLDPWDRTRLVFPPLAALGLALPVFGALLGASHLLVPRAALPTGTALMAGLLAGYIAYDMTHYYTHHAKPRTRWGKYLKAYHLAHHHKHPDRLFGVSQPFWDLVFRTGRPATVR